MTNYTKTILAILTVLLFANVDGEKSSDLTWALIGVMLPSLLLICIVGGVYFWVKRRKKSLVKTLKKTGGKENPDVTMLSEPFSYNCKTASIYPYYSQGTQETRLKGLEESALEDLEQIFRLNINDKELQKSYALIANLVKDYISEKYGIKMKQLTTTQILESLPNSSTDLVVDHVGEILRGCDMVEFSHYRLLRANLMEIYVSTKEFLEKQLENNADAEI